MVPNYYGSVVVGLVLVNVVWWVRKSGRRRVMVVEVGGAGVDPEISLEITKTPILPRADRNGRSFFMGIHGSTEDRRQRFNLED